MEQSRGLNELMKAHLRSLFKAYIMNQPSGNSTDLLLDLSDLDGGHVAERVHGHGRVGHRRGDARHEHGLGQIDVDTDINTEPLG